MGKVIALEKCSTTIRNITYIYSRTDDKVYYKKYSERDRPDILYVFYEDVSNNQYYSGMTDYLKTEAELISFINLVK